MSDCILIPTRATAGLSFSASAALASHPAPVWTATLHLRGPLQIDLAGARDGDAIKFTATAAETAAWAAGTCWWALRVTDGVDVLEVERGTLEVLPDMVQAAAGFDGRSENEKALEAVEAVLAKRATLDQERYRINNRELYRTPISDLIKLRRYYARAVAREKGTTGGRWGRAVPVRFS